MSSRFLRFVGPAVAVGFGVLSIASASAQTFDCGKPVTPADRTVCGSADLKVAAEELADARRQLIGNTPVDERDAIKIGQRAFDAERDRTCTGSAAVTACQALYDKRSAELGDLNAAAEKALGAIVAGIPKDAKAAETALRRYDGGVAKAWLVYLYHSGTVPVADREDRVRALVASVIANDLPTDPYLLEEMKNLGDVATAPTATMLLFLRHVLSTTEMEVPCFLFTKHGQPAFEAFGAFWGNSRDETPELCAPAESVYDMPEWQKVGEQMEPAVEPALDERGSIRLGYERQFEVDDLQASLVPSTLLEAPSSTEAKRAAEQRKRALSAFRTWKDFAIWPESSYKATQAALPSALAATAKLYRERFGLSPRTAEAAAQEAADRFIAGRLILFMPDE